VKIRLGGCQNRNATWGLGATWMSCIYEPTNIDRIDHFAHSGEMVREISTMKSSYNSLIHQSWNSGKGIAYCLPRRYHLLIATNQDAKVRMALLTPDHPRITIYREEIDRVRESTKSARPTFFC
jgi:hypothetical protein